jgi:hydrophobic/amphiphilic exporter-1 (mainly G- bacteria), HAE1 family
MTFTQLIIKRPTIVVVLFTILTVLGIVSYTKLNYDLFPKMNIPIISITTLYPGASASEVENSVTKKLEDALSSIENMESMNSTSQEGVSSITINLESSADVNMSLQDAQRKVNAIEAQLPTDAKTPTINKFSSDDMPIMKLGITANLESTQLYQIAKDQIKSRFLKT